MMFLFQPKSSKERLEKEKRRREKLEEKERRIVELEEWEREKKERRRERREEEEYRREEKRRREEQRREEWRIGRDEALEDKWARREWLDAMNREGHVPAALPPKQYPERAPQWSGPSLGKWDPQWGTPSLADYGKFCLLILVILSLFLCLMFAGSCFFITIIGLLGQQ